LSLIRFGWMRASQPLGRKPASNGSGALIHRASPRRSLAAMEGMTPEQRRAFDLHLRAVVEEARAADRQAIGGLTQEVQRLTVTRTTASGSSSSVFDTFDRLSGKPPSFTGEESRWDSWFFKFRAYVVSAGGVFPNLVAGAEDFGTEIGLASMTPDEQGGARRLYLLLVLLTEEAALSIVKSVSDNNGVVALRKLIQRYNPSPRGGCWPR